MEAITLITDVVEKLILLTTLLASFEQSLFINDQDKLLVKMAI